MTENSNLKEKKGGGQIYFHMPKKIALKTDNGIANTDGL